MLVLTKHAEEAIEKRGLVLDWIGRAVVTLDFTHNDPDDPALTRSFNAIEEAGGRILRVVHRQKATTL